jgi:N,N-dimethylformamidase
MKRRRRTPVELSRRKFLKTSGATMAAAAASRIPARASSAPTPPGMPPHRALDVPGVHAYPMEHSVAGGDTLELCVSSSTPYRLSICRLGLKVDDPAGDTVIERFGKSPANPQAVHPGSYVHVAKRIEGPLRAITLECWLRPWDSKRSQGIISQRDTDSREGLSLEIGPDGSVGFYLGDGTRPVEQALHRTKAGVLARNQWYHLVATWDGRRKRVFVDAKEAGAWDFAGLVLPGGHDLRLGALGRDGSADDFLDGDLAMPALYDRALSPDEVRARFAAKGFEPARGEGVLACWPLAEERGERVADGSGHDRHGRIINHGTWMIGGPSFEVNVPRFGGYDPLKDARRGHGLRLASDDLFDCRWTVTHRWQVPADAPSGIYVARMEFEAEGKPRLYHCTFIVRRAPRRKKAPVLLVAATNTWRAYSGTPFALTPEPLHVGWSTKGIEKDPRGLPAFCFYREHAAGQGTYHVGLRMPWPAAGPYVLYGVPTRYSHLARADRFSQVWLEEQGYDHDVVSDLDLHRDPGLLRGYKAVMIVGHNEYWSEPMYRSLDGYLRGGGNLIVLSGNTMFWRVSFNDEGTVMECRKADAAGRQVPATRRGEAWHSDDGHRGGMMRECGLPGINLIALDCLGFNAPSQAEQFGPYVVESPEHFLFNTPEKTGLKRGDEIGLSAGGFPCANGHEFDIRPSTFARLQEQPLPEGGVIPPDPAGIELLANGQVFWKKGGSAFDYFFNSIKPATDQGGEMIYWERPRGGRVFNAGTIASGWVLGADQKWSTVMRNVLHHFGVTKAKI